MIKLITLIEIFCFCLFTSIHTALWEAVSQFTNSILQLEIPSFEEDENGKIHDIVYCIS